MSVGSVVIEDGVEVLYRYKYLPFNDNGLKMVTEGTLKFTCPLEFNDPFDCIPAYDPESIEKLGITRPDLLKKAGAALGMTPAQRIQKRSMLLQNVKNAVESGAFAKDMAKNVSIFCVSRTPCHTLMWSHYANCHKGFVVELKIAMNAPSELVEFVLPQEVNYKSNRPVLDWGRRVDEEDLINCYFTKSIDWEYEQEERVINPGQVAGIYSYSRENFLNSVIAGANIDNSDYKILRRVLSEASNEISREIPLYRAKLSQKKYRVYVPNHPDPDTNKD